MQNLLGMYPLDQNIPLLKTYSVYKVLKNNNNIKNNNNKNKLGLSCAKLRAQLSLLQTTY